SGNNTGALEILPGRAVNWGTGRTAFTIGSNTTLIGVDAGSSLALNGTVGGNNTLFKAGPGILETQGTASNTNANTVTILDGTIRLNKQKVLGGGLSSGGGYVVGDHVGTDVLEIAQPEQIPDTAAQTVNSSGILRTVLFPSGGAQN